MAVFYLPLYFFCATFVAISIVLCVVTLSQASKRRRAMEFPRVNCKCKACLEKIKRLSTFKSLKFLEPLTLSFATFTLLVVTSTFVGQTTITDSYNPYKVLNVSDRASLSVISSVYPRLTRTARGNEAVMKKLDEARKCLMDSTIQRNYEIFGNRAGLKLIGLGNTFISPAFFELFETYYDLIRFTLFFFGLLALATWFVAIKWRKAFKRDELNITEKVYAKLLKESPESEDILESLSASSK